MQTAQGTKLYWHLSGRHCRSGCIDGDKLRFEVTYGDPDEDLWSDMPDHVFELGGYGADTGLVQ